MKIAITGANGFVGSNLANYFHARDHEVIAVVRPGADTSLLNFEIKVIPTDYCSTQALEIALADAELVIHNAAKTRTLNFNEMIQANVVTTRNVVQACNASPDCKHFIYISSLAAGRPSSEGKLVNEESGSAPVEWYGRSKVLAERIIRNTCTKNWTIVRPSSVYGPRERDFLQIFKVIKSGISFHIGAEEQMLCLIYVDELCEFLNLCATNPQAYGQVFYASDGEVYTHTQFSAIVAGILGVKTREIAIPTPLARIFFHAGDLYEQVTRKTTLVNTQKMKELININWICSISKAKSVLGWNPQPDLEANLRTTIEWYKEQGWL